MSTRVCESGSRGGEADGERLSLRLRVPPLTIGGDAMVGEKTGDAIVGEKTGAWTGKKKAKVQSAPTSEGVDMTAPVISTEPGPEQARAGQVEGFDLKQVEGFDWTEADVKEAIDSFDRRISLPDRDDKFWEVLDDQKTEELYKRLAICHIRAHKGAGLNDEQLLDMLQKDGPFYPYDRRPLWHFDKFHCKIAGFQDYQRLILHDYGYLSYFCYIEACSTLESDQQFVLLWEKLLDKTKWLQHYHKLTLQEREIMDRVTYYHAAKIVSADCPQIYSMLLFPLLMDFKYSVLTDHFYARLYFEIWKRVAKQKMNLKDALDEVNDEALWPVDWPQVKAELESDDVILSDNYKACVAGIDDNIEDGEAYWSIAEAVRNIDPFQLPRLMTYYEFAKKKLDIADKMGLIGSSPHALPDGTV